jgi:hypothetical protein
MQAALQYYLKRKIGARWFRELTRVANFYLGDSPGVGFMAANWVFEEGVAYAEVAVSELRQMFVASSLRQVMEFSELEPEQLQEAAQEYMNQFEEALSDPDVQTEVVEGMLVTMFPELRDARVKKMARELLKQRQAGVEDPIVDFPKKYVRRDEPEVRAMRFGYDMILPSDVRDFEDTPYYFTVHNLTETGVAEKARAEEWTPAFKDAVLNAEEGQKGNFTFRNYRKNDGGKMVTVDDDYAAHRYQVITAIYKATNDDGVAGIYYLTFHHDIQMAAHDQRLINYKHGKYPVVAFAREYISNSLLESRGVSDVWGAQQNQRKQLLDSGGNNALLGGVPPVLSKNRRGKGRAWLKPFKEVQLRRDGELKYMDPPKYPAQVRDMYAALGTDRDAYFGKRNEELPAQGADLHEQYSVIGFLEGVRELLVQMMQLIQQFADDETLERISGQSGEVIRSREEIMGQFDLELKFNPRWMDTEYLKAYGEIMNQMVVTLDRDKTINTSPIAQQILYGLDPELAPSIITDTATANADEVKDEQDIYTRIAAGIEPEMDEDENAKNYGLRLQWLEGQLQASPAWQDWPEVSQEILQAHVQNYQQMVSQQENAQTGRTGVESVTGMV